MLALEINVRAEINQPSDCPPQPDAECTAKQAHGARLGKEQAPHVKITGTESLHDSDFAPAFEDGHHQCIDDADRSHCQCEATEYRKEDVEHGKELAHIAGCVDNRKSAESHLLDGI